MSIAHRTADAQGVTPYFAVAGAAEALDWYARAFGAEELYRLGDGGRIGHAALRIGGAAIVVADEYPEHDILGPKARGGATIRLKLMVDDVDAAFARAIEAGATAQRAVADQFYGDRAGTLADPFGHVWTLATHVEDVAPDELQRRLAALPPD